MRSLGGMNGHCKAEACFGVGNCGSTPLPTVKLSQFVRFATGMSNTLSLYADVERERKI